jgi:phospholipid/cholesterol/gamma-HCH transport system ATP-binding protein
MEDLVEIDDLHFAYGTLPVLRGLTLRIPRGKVVGILGTSGSGKSTLLRLIGGQLRPDRGSVRFHGEDVHALDTSGLYRLRRDMGLMFQAGGLFSDLTVAENVAFALREHTRLDDELIATLVAMKLQAVGLRGAAGLMPAELSGGMARRVALARAIAMDPLLSMYDEPFAGLDPISLNAVARLIRRLNDALGTTSIVVTYDVTESLKVADYIYLIADGRVVAEGGPADLANSADPYATQFIRAEPEGPVPFHLPAVALGQDLGLPR